MNLPKTVDINFLNTLSEQMGVTVYIPENNELNRGRFNQINNPSPFGKQKTLLFSMGKDPAVIYSGVFDVKPNHQGIQFQNLPIYTINHILSYPDQSIDYTDKNNFVAVKFRPMINPGLLYLHLLKMEVQLVPHFEGNVPECIVQFLADTHIPKALVRETVSVRKSEVTSKSVKPKTLTKEETLFVNQSREELTKARKCLGNEAFKYFSAQGPASKETRRVNLRFAHGETHLVFNNYMTSRGNVRSIRKDLIEEFKDLYEDERFGSRFFAYIFGCTEQTIKNSLLV